MTTPRQQDDGAVCRDALGTRGLHLLLILGSLIYKERVERAANVSHRIVTSSYDLTA